MGNMKGKRVLITGATNGIGKQAALELAKMGASVVVVGRNEIKTRKVALDLKTLSGSSNIDLLIADLSSMAEVRRIAAEYRDQYQRLDVLLNNAGAAFSEYHVSADGYEMTFALNHFSYYLLTLLLLDILKLTAREQGEARVVNVSSSAHRNGTPRTGLQFDKLRDRSGYSLFRSYGASKLANVLFTYELARRLEGSGVTANVLHPGLVRTGFGHNSTGFIKPIILLMQRLFAISPEKGAETMVYLAAAAEVAGTTGKYWYKKKPTPSSDMSHDREQQRRLWEFSAEVTGVG